MMNGQQDTRWQHNEAIQLQNIATGDLGAFCLEQSVESRVIHHVVVVVVAAISVEGIANNSAVQGMRYRMTTQL